MANVLINEDSMTAIANAIRSKNGTQTTYKPAQMAEAISAISGGGITPTGTVQITQNGTHNVAQYASAEVNVPTGSTPTGTKQITVTENGTITEDVASYASAEITTNVPTGGSSPHINGVYTVTLDETASNTQTMCNLILSKAGVTKTADHMYLIYLLNKGRADWITDQMVTATCIGTSNYGGASRYRSNALGQVNVSTGYDATCEVGDTYVVVDCLAVD